METIQDEYAVMALPLAERVKRVRAEVEEEFGGTNPDVVDGGWNRVLLYRDAPEPYVVKVPLKDNMVARAELSVEFNTLAFLIDAPNAPLQVPRPLVVPLKTPNYLAATLVAGRTFTQAEMLEAFSEQELTAYGQAIAKFVLYERTALQVDEFEEAALDVSGPWSPPNDREAELIAIHAQLRKSPIYEYQALHEAVLDVFHEYRTYFKDGYVQRDMIGHNDLRPDNLTFIQRDGLWQPRGIIDFGTVGPTDMARELRHLPRLGEAALRAALEALKTHSTRPLPKYLEDCVKMWTRVQVVATAANSYASNLSPPESIMRDMERLFPKEDWSELRYRTQRATFVVPQLGTESC